jgi:hypothetical protein
MSSKKRERKEGEAETVQPGESDVIAQHDPILGAGATEDAVNPPHHTDLGDPELSPEELGDTPAYRDPVRAAGFDQMRQRYGGNLRQRK